MSFLDLLRLLVLFVTLFIINGIGSFGLDDDVAFIISLMGTLGRVADVALINLGMTPGTRLLAVAFIISGIKGIGRREDVDFISAGITPGTREELVRRAIPLRGSFFLLLQCALLLTKRLF